MFLSMLAADAAASHGHEFSQPVPAPPRRATMTLSLPRSSIRPPAAVRPKPALSRAVSDPLGRRTLNSPTSTLAEAKEITVRFEDHLTRSESLSSVEDSQPVRGQHVDTAKKSNDTQVKIATNGVSEKATRKIRRSKTIYNLAHPPPQSKHSLRAKAVFHTNVQLQLLRAEQGKRPTPAFEAIQSSLFNPTLSKRCAHIHHGRIKLGTHDIVIAEAEDYSRRSGGPSAWENRRILGIICGCDHKSIRICMEEGVWTARKWSTGRYDFVPSDSAMGHSRIGEVRWVQARRRPTGARGRKPVGTDEPRFTFSTICPDRRRHPVIASSTRSSIEILDEYSLPLDTHGSETSSMRSADGATLDRSSILTHAQFLTTDDELRDMIIITNIWVAFCEGWAQNLHASVIPSEASSSPQKRPVSMQPFIIGSSRTPSPVGQASVKSAADDERVVETIETPTKKPRYLRFEERLRKFFRRDKAG